MATVINITTVKISSDGAWQGENPLEYALPLLIIQTTLILVLSRTLAFLFKPLRQPKVVAEIVVCRLPSFLSEVSLVVYICRAVWLLGMEDGPRGASEPVLIQVATAQLAHPVGCEL